MEGLPEPLNFTGTLFLLHAHWVWMAVALGLGCWVGWRIAGEAATAELPDDAPGDGDGGGGGDGDGGGGE